MQHRVSDEHRAAMNGHRGAVLWMTGLPAAGKSKIAANLKRALFDRATGCSCSTETTCGAGCMPISGFRGRIAPRISAASAKWK
jgi:hypothetical protein